MFAFLLFAGTLAMHLLGENYYIPYILYAILNHILFMGLVVLFFQAGIGKKIFAGSVLIVIKDLSENFCASFLSGAVLVFLHTVKKEPIPVIDVDALYDNLLTGMAVAAGISAVSLFSKRMDSVFGEKFEKWYIVSSVPLFVVLLVSDLAGWGASHGILFRGGENWNLYYDQLFSHTGDCILRMLSMFAAGAYVFGMNTVFLEQRKREKYQAQVAGYKMLDEQYRKMERLRHDMKNHVIALEGLLEDREWKKMEHYLKKMGQNGGIEGSEEATGNKVIDTLLYRKRKMAEDKKIKWECDVRMPKSCCIDEFDWCVMFGNLLDNAIEACERLEECRHRFIDIQGGLRKQCFLLEVKNSTATETKHENRFAGKDNRKRYGIGLLNVNDIVDRYNGAMNIEVHDGIFIISILIPLDEGTVN